MHIPIVSAWVDGRRERKRTRADREAAVASDLARIEVATVLHERVLPETMAATEPQRRKADTIIRAAVAKVQAASGSFPPRPHTNGLA